MEANSNVLGNAVREFPQAWEETRCWAEKVFSKEKMKEVGITVGVVTAVLALLGLVEYSIYQAIENATISGVGASVFGYF